MDTPATPSSFIPKKPLTTSSRAGSSALGMFIFFIALLVFIASIVAAGVAFTYQKYLQRSIASASTSLQNAEAAFDPQTIDDLTRLDARMSAAEGLLQQHTTLLGLFNFLSQETLTQVQFTQFSYQLQDDGTAQLSLTGVADSFSAVALQSDQFNAASELKNVVFSGITNGTSNQVTFTVAATVDPSVINYAKNIGALPPIGAATSTATSTIISTSSTTPAQ